MKIIDPDDSQHGFVLMVRDHTALTGYRVLIRDEETKEEEYATFTSTYDSDEGELTGVFNYDAKEGKFYTIKVSRYISLTADCTLITADTSLYTADQAGILNKGVIYNGMIFATTQTDFPKFEMMLDMVVVPQGDGIEFITPGT